MKTITRFLTLCAGFIVLASTGAVAAEGWGTDYKAALAQAAEQKRPILVDFTGSDWCGWCIKLDKETFSQPAFKEYADTNLVLLEADFPNSKNLSDELKKQNEELQKKFGVEGFPTLVLLDSSGKEIARQVGYLEGGPAALIDWVKKATKS
jgi:thioredoxin-related protein